LIKEYSFDRFKIIDDGFVVEIYQSRQDKFSNTYFSHVAEYRYKENPNQKSPHGITMLGYPEGVQEMGNLLKLLLEENEHLKFYAKVDKVIE
jgi:hypothetical protein